MQVHQPQDIPPPDGLHCYQSHYLFGLGKLDFGTNGVGLDVHAKRDGLKGTHLGHQFE